MLRMSLVSVFALLLPCALLHAEALPERELFPGITTTRTVPGAPFALAGKRIFFANWYYIQPGDLDWRNVEGKSVYVDGDEGLFDAQHVGINAPRGIRLFVEKPEVIGPFEMPYRTILQDGPLYRGWTSTEYFESADGRNWEKKALLELDALHEDGVHNVFIDPTAQAEARLKAVWVGHITRAQFEAFRAKRPDGWEPKALFLLGEKDEVSCLRGSVSPDGIHWTTLPDPLVVEYSDTLNTAYYDAALRKFVIYTRQWAAGTRAEQLPADLRNSWTGVGRRAIGRSESSDFSQFPPSETVLEPSLDMLPSETLYTNGHTVFPGAPDQHLMFPVVWNASVTDTTRVVLASSHDGKLWQWVPGGNLLETQAFGQWDGGCIWVNPNLIEFPNGDWGIPYTGHNLPHKYPRGKRVGGIGYAVWPKGRLVGVEAVGEGEFTLMPVIPPGLHLKINALTKRTGWIRIEVAGVDAQTFDACAPVVGDQLWTEVTWNGQGGIQVPAGTAITLRFKLHQAQLFGLQFE